ncbi:hypothetical protein T484DRAFT_2548288 [Baffinella frigidus]|nr:hypothetical protein T484DRAFT_2548288 [Cryptophyta sp. CCMP2293]
MSRCSSENAMLQSFFFAPPPPFRNDQLSHRARKPLKSPFFESTGSSSQYTLQPSAAPPAAAVMSHRFGSRGPPFLLPSPRPPPPPPLQSSERRPEASPRPWQISPQGGARGADPCGSGAWLASVARVAPAGAPAREAATNPRAAPPPAPLTVRRALPSPTLTHPVHAISEQCQAPPFFETRQTRAGATETADLRPGQGRVSLRRPQPLTQSGARRHASQSIRPLGHRVPARPFFWVNPRFSKVDIPQSGLFITRSSGVVAAEQRLGEGRARGRAWQTHKWCPGS